MDFFGPEWVFSDLTEEYYHRALTCEEKVTKNIKAFYRCIKLAKIRSCRHPTHGVELYKYCEHPDHGVLSYKECRAPEFGILEPRV